MTKYLFTMVLCWLGISGVQAQILIKGQVVDGSDVALSGVTIQDLSAAENTTVSNADGTFTIRVRDSQTRLRFSFMGLKEVEVTVGTQKSLFIRMDESQSPLEEVVVTGYSTQKRSQITASVATVSGEDLLKNPASHSAANLLQGKAAGVDVAIQTGRPGATPTVRIRGRSSISSQTAALWVVDGIIIHGTPDINPNDIESMSVLKDGAATSQYGSRGVNGVVVVTTRQAKQIGQSRLNASLRTGASRFNADNFSLMNERQMYDVFQQFSGQAGAREVSPSVMDNPYDWVANGTQAGRLSDLHLTYTGKTEKAAIYTSGNYYKEEGSVKGFSFDRFAGRMNVDYALTDRLTFKPKINMTYRSEHNQQHSLYSMFLNMPWDNPFRPNGTVVNPRRDADLLWYGRDATNYLYDLQYNYSTSRSLDAQSNIDFEYRLNNDFTLVSSNNLAYFNAEGLGYVDPASDAGLADNGRLSNSSQKRIVRFTNQMLRYQKAIGDHQISAFAAYEYNDYKYKSMSATGRGIVPGSTVLDAASAPQSIGGTTNDYAFQSIMMQGEYSYGERYSLQGSVRRDGSSRFGQEN